MRAISRIMSSMLTADHLLTVVDAFRDARKVSDSRVSTLLFNDGKRIASVRRGGDIGSRHLAGAFQWLSDHWPEPAPWPTSVPRPGVQELAEEATSDRSPDAGGGTTSKGARQTLQKEVEGPISCFSPRGLKELPVEGQPS